MSDEKPLLHRLRKDGPKDFALEALKYGWSAWLWPIIAGAWLVVTTSLAGWFAWWGSVDPLWKLVGVLLAIGASLWVARHVLDLAKVIATTAATGNSDAGVEKGEKGLSPENSFSLFLASGRVGWRTARADKDGDKFVSIKAAIHNKTNRTISGIQIGMRCRSWTAGAKFANYRESDRYTVSREAITLHPWQTYQFVLFERAIGEMRAFLGNHADEPPVEIIELDNGAQQHFITVIIGAQDTIPEFKNLVVVTFGTEGLLPLEFDSRRWGADSDAPAPFMENKAAVQ